MEEYKKIIEILTKNNKTLSSMESCIGGGIANEITNHPGASNVFKFCAVTYSNEFKIKMGVDESIIEKYSVYSMNTAIEMAKSISLFANSNYGIGITGKLNRSDENNPFGEDNKVYISIYDRDNEKYFNDFILAQNQKRSKNKELILKKVSEILLDIIN